MTKRPAARSQPEQAHRIERKLLLLETERVVLRFPTADDVGVIISFYEKNASYLGKHSPSVKESFFNRVFWLKRISEIQNDFDGDRACNFFVFGKSRYEILGYVNFSNFVRGALQACTLGYGLTEEAQGQGLMAEALRAAIKYVMRDLNMHRIEANYHPNNYRSARILKTLGFEIEGMAIHYLRINGAWQPHVRASLTNHDWQAE